jgi:hypothetical protein
MDMKTAEALKRVLGYVSGAGESRLAIDSIYWALSGAGVKTNQNIHVDTPMTLRDIPNEG